MKKKISSIAVSFGPYHCEDNYRLAFYRGIPSLAVFLGLILTVYLSDNYSRKKITIICSLTTVLGYIIVLSSQSMTQAMIGLIIFKLTSFGYLKTIQVIITETVEPDLRQTILNFGYMASLDGERKEFNLD